MAGLSQRLPLDSDCPVTKKTGRVRLDLAVQAQGLAASRERARALILAGHILVDDRVMDKAGTLVASARGLPLSSPSTHT